jgi:FkbM family methyltransferase
VEINFSAIDRVSPLGRVLRLPLKLLPDGAVVPILQGPLRGKKWIVGSSNHGCWLGSYEHSKCKVFQAIVRERSVVYDIGANVGYYTLLASQLGGSSGQVFAFEPVPRNCALLRQHLKLNKVSNASLIEAAVSSADGEARFDTGPNPSMGHLAADGALRVRSVTLDTLVFGQATPPPQVIKIDVEGAEAEVLTGGSETLLRHRPLILLATHGETVHRECRRILDRLGFLVESLDGRPIDRCDELIARPSKVTS